MLQQKHFFFFSFSYPLMILDLLPTSSEAIGKGRPLKLGTKNGKSVSTGLTLMTLNLQTLLENIIL